MTSTIGKALSIEDLRRMAKVRLPRLVFDHVEGGLDDEDCLGLNERSFGSYRLLPRYLVDVSQAAQNVTVLDRTYASPFGIAPTGLAGFVRDGGDMTLAEAAKSADIPFVISGHSTSSLEKLARVAQGNAWFQLYIARDSAVTRDMCHRAANAGITNLVVTIDVPIHGKRERNIRNGFVRPYRPTLSAALEALRHPAWLWSYLNKGMPIFENWSPYVEKRADAMAVAEYVSAQMPSVQTWTSLESIRADWPGKLIVKGILHPADAEQAVSMGADGIIVSNHGGRQLDRAPAPIDAFPAVAAAVAGRATLMLDSGVRRGADIVTALCLGAQFVFVGRATLYGLAAGGAAGVRRALEILRAEVSTVMSQLGRPRVEDLGRDVLFHPPGSRCAIQQGACSVPFSQTVR